MKSGFAALLLCCAAGAAPAQEFPSRAVHLIVPYTPSTGADILARVLAPKFSERWKSAVVVENRPGATGNIGTEAVARSAPDGHTLLLAATSFSTNPALTRSLPFDPVKSFAPVGLVATSALAVTVNAQVPARTMREFVDLARRQPGKLYYGSPGNGGVQHLAMELLKLDTGIDVVHVPYKGLGGAIADLIAGQVQALVSALQSVAPHVQAGRLRMLGVMSAERVLPFPDVPTLKEQGMGDLEVETWYALFAPAGTPARATARVNGDLRAIMNDAGIRDLLARQGMNAAAGSPEQMAELLRRELARWARVVNAAGIKAD
jgi:tripartite-type tricarboxylate transporter receptor subunit TctC